MTDRHGEQMADLWKDFDFTKYSKMIRALQAGVAKLREIEGPDGETSPKALRVATNTNMVEFSALIQLLVDKGVIDPMEYERMLFGMLELEVKKYEKSIASKSGQETKLNGYTA
jgi:hypothetical protein